MGCRMKKLVENHWFRGSTHFHSKNVGEPIEYSRCLPLPCFNKFVLTQKNLNFLFVTDQPWCIIWSLYTTLMSKIFPQESSEAFLNLKKSALPRKKTTSPTCFSRVLWKALCKKGMVPFGFSKKKLFGTLPPLLNEPMGFLTKLLEKQFKDSP